MSLSKVTWLGLDAKEPQTWQLELIHSVFFFFFNGLKSLYSFCFNNCIYLFLAVLGLHCCTGFSLVAESWTHPLVVVYRLLAAVASVVACASVVAALGLSGCCSQPLEHRLSSSCGGGLCCSVACGIFPSQESNPCLLH